MLSEMCECDNVGKGSQICNRMLKMTKLMRSCTGLLDTKGMPHPFDQNYIPDNGAFGPDGLFYVAQAAPRTDDSFGAMLNHEEGLCHCHLTMPSPCGLAESCAACWPVGCSTQSVKPCCCYTKAFLVSQVLSLSLMSPPPLPANS